MCELMFKVRCVPEQERVAVFLPSQKHPEPGKQRRRQGCKRRQENNPRRNAAHGDAYAPHQGGHARGSVLVPVARRVEGQTPIFDALSVSMLVTAWRNHHLLCQHRDKRRGAIGAQGAPAKLRVFARKALAARLAATRSMPCSTVRRTVRPLQAACVPRSSPDYYRDTDWARDLRRYASATFAVHKRLLDDEEIVRTIALADYCPVCRNPPVGAVDEEFHLVGSR
jgi:hypothetical protein